MTVRILTGDCRTILPTLEANSVDAVVCDPPYDLTGASRNGSSRQNDPTKPFGRHNLQPTGGFMGAQWDATGVAFDPATWIEVKRVLKPGGYLLAFGGTRTYHRMTTAIEVAGFEIKDCLCWLYGSGMPKHKSLLKPAWEPIVMAKKRGKGTINRDACRLATNEDRSRPPGKGSSENWRFVNRTEKSVSHPLGRVPANVLLDEIAADMLDASVPPSTSRIGKPRKGKQPGDGWGATHTGAEYADSGGPSRFFYCAKADDAEKDRGLPVGTENDHPTVKPIAVMQWLVRLVAVPGQTVLDPFFGSGTTGIACDREQVDCLGIDLTEHFTDIAAYRIRGDSPMFANVEVA